ncbi:MAG: hypothetical protein EOP04_14880, partial [Proteobacteria bacterium]
MIGQALVLGSILIAIFPAFSAPQVQAPQRDIVSDFVICEAGLPFCLLLIFNSFSHQVEHWGIWIGAESIILLGLIAFLVRLCGSKFSVNSFRIWTQFGILIPIMVSRSSDVWLGEFAILDWFIGMQALRLVVLMTKTPAVKAALTVLIACSLFAPVFSFDFLIGITYLKLDFGRPEFILLSAIHLLWVICGVLAFISLVKSEIKDPLDVPGLRMGSAVLIALL